MTRIASTQAAFLALGLLGCSANAETFEQSSFSVSPQTFVRERSTPVLNPSVAALFEERGEAEATIWVWFTDKGFRDLAGFLSARASVSLTDRAQKRRAKVGRDAVVLADLAISPDYVMAVQSRGGILRHQSRWLNAASFELPLDSLSRIAELPFVARISPVGRREPASEGYDLRNPDPQPAALGVEDGYGPSLAQNQLTHVVEVHKQGYTGRGVMLAMLDTGFNKSHAAFKAFRDEGRIRAEWDFVMYDGNTSQQSSDPPYQADHGTATWSLAAGYDLGQIIGPAFGCSVILCKTESMTIEAPIEEDNWVAAVEYADRFGADVISSSVGWMDWYTPTDKDGLTAPASQVASSCDGMGIVLAQAVGNHGPSGCSMVVPADAFDILAVGSVGSQGYLADNSSRGPTHDGRIKPEVCAPGEGSWSAYGSTTEYGWGNGTSCAAPQVAGIACLILEAHPGYTPTQIREAIKMTATKAGSPDNSYGWGIVNAAAAMNWPLEVQLQNLNGSVPIDAEFCLTTAVPASSCLWSFGDGAVSDQPTVTHRYTSPGIYDVSVIAETDMGEFDRQLPQSVIVQADTMRVQSSRQHRGGPVKIDLSAHNFVPVKALTIPFTWDGPTDITFDSFSTAGLRTSSFLRQSLISIYLPLKRAAICLAATDSPSDPALPPGDGEVLSLYFTAPTGLPETDVPIQIISYAHYVPSMTCRDYVYEPAVLSGTLSLVCCMNRAGDANGTGGDEPTIGDISTLVDMLFISGDPGIVPCLAEADVNQSGGLNPTVSDITIGDVSELIDYLFITGSSKGLPDCM